MSATAVEVGGERDMLRALDEATREYADVISAWRESGERAHLLSRGRVLITDDLSGKTREKKLDEAELVIERAALDRWKLETAERLKAARQRLDETKVEAANTQLGPVLERHRVASAKVQEQVGRVENALVQLAVEVFELDELRQAEAVPARQAVRIACEGASSDDLRRRIRGNASVELPARLTVTNVWSIERPVSGLFGSEANDTSTRRFWDGIGSWLSLPRERAMGHLAGTRLGKRIEKTTR